MTPSEATAALAQFDHVHVSEVSPDGIRVQIDHKAESAWKFLVIMLVVGPLIALLGFKMPTLLPAEYLHGPMATQVQLLPTMGILCAAMGLMVALIRLANGKGRDIILEARPGSLHADRDIAGDHVVRTYSANEVQGLSVEGSMLSIHTRMGPMTLANFGPPKAVPILATLLASRLWHPDDILSGHQKTGFLIPGTFAPMSVDQLWILPASRLNVAGQPTDAQ